MSILAEDLPNTVTLHASAAHTATATQHGRPGAQLSRSETFHSATRTDSAGFGDTPRFGGVGRKWATHSVCNLSRRISDFSFFSSKEHPSRGRNGRPSQAGRARRTSLSEGGVASLRVSVTYVREDHPRPARRGPLAQRQGRSASTARSRVRVRLWRLRRRRKWLCGAGSAVSVCGRTEASVWPWRRCGGL